MMQLEIFQSAAATPRARRCDPATSHEAAERSIDLAAQHQMTIIKCLKAHGPLGKDGIASRSRLTGVQVARRLPELKSMGLVKLSGQRVASTSGRSEREWEIVA
jgi:predicted ArsR family transcriptional regulator